MGERLVSRWHPWQVARAALIDVRREKLEVAGAWDPDQPDIIWLDQDLGQAGRRSTLTHELIHRQRGDEAGCTPWHDRHQERRVDFEAARQLIPLDAFVDALLWGQDEHELADELWVDVATVRARIEGLSTNEFRLIDERLWAAEGTLP